RHHEVLEQPHVAPLPVLGVAVEPVVAAFELQPHLLARHAGAAVAEAGRQLPLPQVAWLENVVVDRDDVGEVVDLGRDIGGDTGWTHDISYAKSSFAQSYLGGRAPASRRCYSPDLMADDLTAE